MSNTGKFKDYIPTVRTAGKVTAIPDESANKCINNDNPIQTPGTPPDIKKYRKSFHNQPGIKQVHYGRLNDPLPSLGFAYGKPTQGYEKMDELIKANNSKGLAEFSNNLNEAKYASNIREPLAQSYQRSYKYPDQVNDSNFRFGVATVGSESAKDVLYPQGGDKEEAPQIKKLYTKTHGNYAPGEQKTRDYQWGIDKNDHRFGASDVKVLNGAATALHAERINSTFPKTIIVEKTVEDHKAVSQEQLGKSKNLGQKNKYTEPDHCYGIKSTGNGWNAGKCIHGEPTSEKELREDIDLGKSVKVGSRNVVRKPEDENRVFGVPTIRADIPKKIQKSVADHTNYGDEPEAIDLLSPNTFLELGITEEDFSVYRSPQEIRQLFGNIGFDYKQGKFNAIYNRAREYCNWNENVSIRAFMEAVKELHALD